LPVDFAVAEAKRLARKERRKNDRAIASHGKWPVVNGVMLIPDPLNPRGQREVCVTDRSLGASAGHDSAQIER